MDCASLIQSLENIKKFKGNSKDPHMLDKQKSISEHEEAGASEKKLKAQANDDPEGERSIVKNIQMDKDISWCKDAGRGM